MAETLKRLYEEEKPQAEAAPAGQTEEKGIPDLFAEENLKAAEPRDGEAESAPASGESSKRRRQQKS